jgi:hypothetical protein
MAAATLPHCPTPTTTGHHTRCGCPPDHPALWRVHWTGGDGTPLHCSCGPRELTLGSGQYLGASSEAYAYACDNCCTRPGLKMIRGLAADMPCCFCPGTASGESGHIVLGHAAN